VPQPAAAAAPAATTTWAPPPPAAPAAAKSGGLPTWAWVVGLIVIVALGLFFFGGAASR